jgi:hypothetical protein
MPIMNLGQLMSTATTFASRTDLLTSDVSLYVNAAAEFVGIVIGHSGQEALAVSSTTSGENRISVPTDYEYGVALSNLSLPITTPNRDLTKRDVAWMDSQGTSSGAPAYWADYASWIEVYPSPDSSYSLQLRYTTKTPTLVQSSETLPFKERYHWAVALKATALIHAARENIEGEAIAEARFVNWFNNVPSDRAKLQQQSKQGMNVSFKRS